MVRNSERKGYVGRIGRWGGRGAGGHSRSLPVAHSPMVLVILNMCVMSEGSKSLSCERRGRSDRGQILDILTQRRAEMIVCV